MREKKITKLRNKIWFSLWASFFAIADISEVLIGGLFDENIVFALKSGKTVSVLLSELFQEISAI